MKQPTKVELKEKIANLKEEIANLHKIIGGVYEWSDRITSISWCWECARKFEKADCGEEESEE